MIRVLVVDDHELVRIGLRYILADYPAIQIAGEAVDGESALRMNRQLRPDVVLLDICLPGLSGFEVTKRLKQASPGLGIVILSVHEQAPFPAQLLEAGASAYLTKGCPATELVEAINTVARGGRHIGSRIAQQMALNLLPGHGSSPFEELSAREMEVMLMLADGKVELYEIKWDKLRNAVQRRIAEKVPMHPVWGRQAAVYGSGVKFNRC